MNSRGAQQRILGGIIVTTPPPDDRTALVTKLAPVYCSKHQNLKFAKLPKLPDMPSYDGVGSFTPDQCNTIIGKLYDADLQEDHISDVANAQIFIGMSQLELMYAWGEPNDINNTTSTYGTHDQWVYGTYDSGSKPQYVYVDNGVVSSFQN